MDSLSMILAPVRRHSLLKRAPEKSIPFRALGKPRDRWLCRRWRHLNFLPSDSSTTLAWKGAWPTHRQGHNWDAIGQLRFGAAQEWLLVEAKANIEELLSECQAEDPASIKRIGETMGATKSALGAGEACNWMRPYYQLCNRLAALHFLNAAGSPAGLLYVYFCGDLGDRRRTCPKNEEGWRSELEKQDQHIGLPANHPLNARIYKLFIDVQCRN